jgi:2-oxoglutarate dehydrogenase E2 component (dihydrolipoamide succinyltransferase)
VHEREERVRMTRLRQTSARRLKEAQNAAAMLTTFNEVDMSAVMALRNTHKDAFEKRHGVKLGFMGFFVKACVHALKQVPPKAVLPSLPWYFSTKAVFRPS